jgi:threonine synthase
LCLVGCRTFIGVPLNATRDLRRLYTASSAYAEDHNGQLPSSIAEMAGYVGEKRLLKEYKLVASGYFTDIQTSATTPVFRTSHRNWDGEYIAVFGDGRCGKLQGAEKK